MWALHEHLGQGSSEGVGQSVIIIYNNLINRYSVAGSTRTVARTVGSDQGQYLVLGKMGGKRGRFNQQTQCCRAY